jgi:ribosomal protein S18 acetylase RimI-like enzyme
MVDFKSKNLFMLSETINRDQKMNIEKNGYYITDDQSKLNREHYTKSLKNTYWANTRSDETIEKVLANSVMVSIFYQEKQVGFTRLVTDYSTFSYVCDVYIEPECRGKGLGRYMMDFVSKCPAGNTKLSMLTTNNAAELYRKFGYEKNDDLMIKREINIA